MKIPPNHLIVFFFLTIQAIQRQLEEVAEKQRDVEERGVAIEKILRGETERGKPHTHDCTDPTPAYLVSV